MAIFDPANPEHVRIFEEYQKLDEDVKQLEEALANEPDAQKRLIINDEYLRKVKEWKEYQSKYKDIIFAQCQE